MNDLPGEPAWNHSELIDSLPSFRHDLEADGLLTTTIDGNLRHARWFLDWRVGQGAPRGRAPRSPAAPVLLRVVGATLRADLKEYREYLASSHRPNAVNTYVNSSAVFVAWRTGKRRAQRSRERQAQEGPNPPLSRAGSTPSRHQDPRVTGWPSEASVQSSVVAWLVSEGWSIERVADTASREHGVDILARNGTQQMAIEVKGYPSELYATGELAGQPRKYNPAAQVRTYMGNALLAILTMRDAIPGAQIALALPDIGSYPGLVAKVEQSLIDLEVLVLLVGSDGSVVEGGAGHNH